MENERRNMTYTKILQSKLPFFFTSGYIVNLITFLLYILQAPFVPWIFKINLLF